MRRKVCRERSARHRIGIAAIVKHAAGGGKTAAATRPALNPFATISIAYPSAGVTRAYRAITYYR